MNVFNEQRMKVSIITATYNSAKTVRDTIESVLVQDYPDIEHIIVDGKSKDATLDIVQEYDGKIAKVVSDPDKGIYDAMNKGIRMATGDIIGILNSDDFFANDHVISEVVRAFREDPTLDGVHADLYYVKQDEPQKIVRHWVTTDYKPGCFFKGWHPAHPTLYLRKEVYERYGLFDLDFPLAADFELMLRLFECHHIVAKHLDMAMIRMRLGGATSKDYTNIVKNTKECMAAFRKNGLKPPVLYPAYRLLPKLLQYVK